MLRSSDEEVDRRGSLVRRPRPFVSKRYRLVPRLLRAEEVVSRLWAAYQCTRRDDLIAEVFDTSTRDNRQVIPRRCGAGVELDNECLSQRDRYGRCEV